MTGAEEKFVALALTMKATNRAQYDELVEALASLKEQHRDRPFAQGLDPHSLIIAIGFARGVAEIHKLFAGASILQPTQPMTGSV